MKSTRFRQKGLVLLLALCMIMTSFGTAFAATDATSAKKPVGHDIVGHWAERTLKDWIDKGLLRGFDDGSIKPNRAVTRAEFVAIVNKSNGFTEQASIDFKDVASKDWFYKEVAIAKSAGYISGYSDQTFKPNKSITREEAAVTLTKLLKLKESASTGGLTDLAKASTWSTGSIGAVIDAGLMIGDQGKFRPLDNLTRAESVTLLQKVLDKRDALQPAVEPAVTYDKPGVYGDKAAAASTTIKGSVLISAADVTLNNIVIEGDLVVGESVGQGEVFFNGVTVKGTTTILGGGKNSIHFNDSVLITVIVNKKDGSIRIVAEGSTSVQEIQLQSGARLEESQLTSSGFGDLVLSSAIPADSEVSLSGRFETVDVIATSINVNLTQGAIQELAVAASATNSDINVGAGADIATLILNAISNVSGQGTIGTANINANGSTITQTPRAVNVGNGVNATVNGQPATTTTSSPSGSSSGSSGSSNDSVTGTVYGFSGTIRDVDGAPVPNVRIDFRRGTGTTTGTIAASAVTNQNGEYFVELPPGIYTGELVHASYITTYVIGVSTSGYRNIGQDATAIRIPASDEIRIVLTWAEDPRDEDSHLLGPTPDGNVFHTWYADREFSVTDTVYADLDHDDVTSYGPETTTIRKRTDGFYQFYVHHFSGESTLRNSFAKVEVYVGDSASPAKVYNIPTGNGDEIYWDVFSMVIAGGEVSFSERNTLTNTRPEYEGTANAAAIELAKFGSTFQINDVSVTGATYLNPLQSLTIGTAISLSNLQPTVTSATYGHYLSIDPSGRALILNDLNTTEGPLNFTLTLTAELNGLTASKKVTVIVPTVQVQLYNLLYTVEDFILRGQLDSEKINLLQGAVDAGNAVRNNPVSTADDYAAAIEVLIAAFESTRYR